MVRRVLVIGDEVGVPRVLKHLDPNLVCAIIAAEVRPHSHSALSLLAAQRQVPFIVQPRSTDSKYASFVQSIVDLAPDLILCDSYSMLLRPDVLRLPRGGAVNVHGGLLPRYRGANPIQWMLINDESEAGVTIHFMDAGFDSGDVIAQRQVAVKFTDTWRDVLGRVNTATEQLLAEQLPLILSGRAKALPQDAARARQFQHRKPSDGLIDWSSSTRAIYNLVRALVAPLPGAFYLDRAQKVVLDRFMPISEVALLKQRMTGGSWPIGGGRRLRLLPTASAQRFDFDVVGVNGAPKEGVSLSALDFAARRAIVNQSRWRTPIEKYARAELGITSLVPADT